jgi:hypothetical protein
VQEVTQFARFFLIEQNNAVGFFQLAGIFVKIFAAGQALSVIQVRKIGFKPSLVLLLWKADAFRS